MEGYIVFLLIAMYAELSLCPLTRHISRVLFYTHTLAILLPIYSPTQVHGLLTGMFIYLGGFITCASMTNTKPGVTIFSILASYTTIIYLMMLTRTMDSFIIVGYDLLQYGDVIFRGLMVVGLGLCSLAVTSESGYKLQMRDLQLAIGGVLMNIVLTAS